MIRTLRITSFVLAAVAAGAVVLLAALGFKSNSDIEALLAQKGVIEQAKDHSQTAPEKEESLSPLVTQARKFALRIDPPPPPPPPAPPSPPRDTARPEPVRPTQPPEPVRPPVVTTGRYSLLATARYEDFPERSLALFKPLVGPAKWHRQGEILGHLEIHEIRDGSVVLHQGGTMNSELFVPKTAPQGKPLLKSDAADLTATAAQPGTPASTADARQDVPGSTDEVAGGTTRQPRGVSRTAPTQTVDAAGRIRRVTTAPPAPAPPPPPREPTPQEQKESIQQSISSIEQIMSRSDVHASEEEQKKEQEAWMQLLQVLQQEQQTLEAAGENNNDTPSPSEQRQEDDSENPPAAETPESSPND